jgi:hypothetical protein
VEFYFHAHDVVLSASEKMLMGLRDIHGIYSTFIGTRIFLLPYINFLVTTVI